MLMCVGCRWPGHGAAGHIHDEPVVNADALFLLGMWLDQELTLQKQFDMLASKLVSLSEQLLDGMTAIGVGLPFHRAENNSNES